MIRASKKSPTKGAPGIADLIADRLARHEAQLDGQVIRTVHELSVTPGVPLVSRDFPAGEAPMMAEPPGRPRTVKIPPPLFTSGRGKPQGVFSD
jgi:hypothetical protein